ncbi:hypothetical protein LMH66_16825 [Shewanella sp. 10N.7]|uniref:hypothetical protein n=1 Tax=Shewanella sp. 10N.7 TaxID=2885093 RepID=UPI001E3B88E5|nr:hypothetical protein [Shewanella sp. 10N.7]MCC4834311.1 hypothetical protein [Shewanella sp. 10N.7]
MLKPALLVLISAVSVSPLLLANADANFHSDSTSTSTSTSTLTPTQNSVPTSSLNSTPAINSSEESVQSSLYPREPIAEKSALICRISDYAKCLAQLPVAVTRQLPSHNDIANSLGFKSAVVFPVNDENVAGLIVINRVLPLVYQNVALNGQIYQLDLAQQSQLTLWHEIGHLQNIALQGKGLPSELTAYEHEWLADVYLVWRLAQSDSLILAWQQLHRRNMAVINDRDNISHWSSPQLLWLLTHYSLEEIKQFEHYSDFISAIYPLSPSIETTEMKEIASLIQRTFNRGVMPVLPNYMFWRQVRLIEVLQPTLSILMGDDNANQWLIEQFAEAPTYFDAKY